MEKEIVYWAVLQTTQSTHDRNSRFTHENLISFFDWLQEQREIIEKETGRKAVITNCGKVV